MATQQRFPTGNGATANWDANGAATVWECVDEASPDDDTTYGSKTAAFARHAFTFTAFAITSSAITSITLYGRGRCTVADGGCEFSLGINVNGTWYPGSAVPMTTTYADAPYTRTLLTNPDTGIAWVEADVEGTGSNPIQSMEHRFSSNSSEGRCTQTSIEVNYTVAGGANPKGPLSNPLAGPFGGPI